MKKNRLFQWGVRLGVVLALIGLLFAINENAKAKDYEMFQKHTKVVKGKVNQKYKQDNANYYVEVISATKSDELIKVNKKQYQTYDKGSTVKFRIDTSNHNIVLIDLNKEADINNKDDLNKYNSNKMRGK
jgi:hypothetical protein